MSEFASPADVAATYEELIPEADYARITALLDEAGLRVMEALGVDDLAGWVAAGPPHRAATLRSVLVEMVQRVIRSPGALVTESEQGYAYSVDRSASSSRLALLPDQLVRLRGRAVSAYGVAPVRIPVGSLRAPVPSSRRWCL